jgi:hypothetical protein
VHSLFLEPARVETLSIFSSEVEANFAENCFFTVEEALKSGVFWEVGAFDFVPVGELFTFFEDSFV